jgi:hypothetical protein
VKKIWCTTNKKVEMEKDGDIDVQKKYVFEKDKSASLGC